MATLKYMQERLTEEVTPGIGRPVSKSAKTHQVPVSGGPATGGDDASFPSLQVPYLPGTPSHALVM